MLLASLATASNLTTFLVGIDIDDEHLAAYQHWSHHLRKYNRIRFFYHDRMSLSAWSNYLASITKGRYQLLVSLGDDHMPTVTDWDYQIWRAHQHMGVPGIIFPVAENALGLPPTAFSVDYQIAHALGWFTHPAMQHYWIDNVWSDLARLSGQGRYLHAPVIDHLHHSDGLADYDETYRISEGVQLADNAAYAQWLDTHAAADAAIIQRLAMP